MDGGSSIQRGATETGAAGTRRPLSRRPLRFPQFQTDSRAYLEAPGAEELHTDADVPLIHPQSQGGAAFSAETERTDEDKEISDKTEKCTRIDCCQLGAC